MKPIAPNGPHHPLSDLILRRPRSPKSGLPDFGNVKVSKSATADFDARPSRRMAAGTTSLVAVLRDARESALLRTRLMDEIARNTLCR